MGITKTQAAEIAHRYGLSLQDAAGLVTLADTTEEAEALAAQFGSEEAQYRNTVRGLFDRSNQSTTPFEQRFLEAAGEPTGPVAS